MTCPHCQHDLDPVNDWQHSQRGVNGAWCKYCSRIDRCERRAELHRKDRARAMNRWLTQQQSIKGAAA